MTLPGRELLSSLADARWRASPGAKPNLRRLLRVVRQVVGAPDYEKYLEHHAARHPGETPPSPKAYYADFVTRRFGGSAPTRCC